MKFAEAVEESWFEGLRAKLEIAAAMWNFVDTNS